jgi:hypothetical protein
LSKDVDSDGECCITLLLSLGKPAAVAQARALDARK